MRVSTISLLLFCIGVTTFHLAESGGGGDKKSKVLTATKSSKTTGGSRTPVTPKKPGVSKKPSELNRFRSVVNSLGQERKAKQEPSRKYTRADSESRPQSPSGGRSPIRSPITSDMTPEEAEATCAQQLSVALMNMGLGNLLEQELNPDMAKELESQLIGHFEHGAEPDDFLMDFNEFKQAQRNVGPKAAVPKQVQPMEFNLDSEPLPGEEGMTMQRRCSKRCFWLYGFIVKPIQQVQAGQEGVTISNQRIITPITEGVYEKKPWQSLSSKILGRANQSVNRCNCAVTVDFFNTLAEYKIGVENSFVYHQKLSSGEAMRLLSNAIAQARKGLQLMEHEEFVELVTFEILKHIRQNKQPEQIMREIRNGVTAANADYRALMQREPPKRVASSKSFFRKLSSYKRQNSRGN